MSLIDHPGAQHRAATWLPRGVAIDAGVCALIVALGALQFAFPRGADDFFNADTIYVELARSIVDNGRYGVDYNDVQYPPGLPALLALSCVTAGCTHGVLIRSMAIYFTLGMLTFYWLLKRTENTAVAATSCLLIASSPVVFTLSTQLVFSDLPYLLTSAVTLALVAMLDRGKRAPVRTAILGSICMVMLVSSLLIRSSGVALLAGLAGWLAVGGLWTDKAARTRRIKTFVAILLAGVVVQTVWMSWVARHEIVDWPMQEGHPRSYLSQLKVKSGLQPELGTASLIDVVLRVPNNLVARAGAVTELITRKQYIELVWYSPLVLGPALLIAIGLGVSLRVGGGSLMEWYFMAHEAMYLIWPWPFEMRFLLPVAPLAFLYLWRGARELGGMLVRSRRAVGGAGAVFGLVAGATAVAAGWNSDAMQARLDAIFWAAIVAASALMALSNRPSVASGRVQQLLQHQLTWSVGRLRLSLPLIVGTAATASLVAIGIALQLAVGKRNLSFDLTQHPLYANVVAAKWIADNTVSTAVVMARQMDVVHYYAHRKIVWFAPTSDPRALMDGIRRLHADFIIAINTSTYYLPSDKDCVDALLEEFPRSFRIAKEERGFRIIKVVSGST